MPFTFFGYLSFAPGGSWRGLLILWSRTRGCCAAALEPDLTEIVTPLTAKTSKTAKKIFLKALRLSFSPDHTPDSILDASTLGTTDKRTPAILALYGLPPLNRQYNAQLLSYPVHCLIAQRQMSKNLCGLRGLRGSNIKTKQRRLFMKPGR